jgi:hypothetical protein
MSILFIQRDTTDSVSNDNALLSAVTIFSPHNDHSVTLRAAAPTLMSVFLADKP